MGNTLCNDCKNTKTGEICCDNASTTVQPTFKMLINFEPTLAPELSQPIIVRLTALQNYPLKVPRCGLIGLQELSPYRNTLDDNIYEGQWLNGKPQGKGKVYFSSGCYLEGEFHEGHPCGVSRIIYSDGSYFQGQIVDYFASGSGKYITNTFEFQGVFSNSRPLCGIIKIKDRGIVSFNSETGKGSIEFGNRKKYNGDLSLGRMMLQDGTVLDGQFKYGQFIGQLQPQDMKSTSSGIMRKRSSKMSSSEGRNPNRKSKDRQFFGVTESQILSFIKIGLPEIQRLSFSCQ